MFFYYLLCTLWVFVKLSRFSFSFAAALFFLFLAHASFILRSAVCFITCQTFFIFSALLAFMYEALATHTHTHTLSLRFRLKAFLSTRSLSFSLARSLRYFLYFIFFSTGIINGQRDRPPSCLGKWSKNKWMIEWKPRQLAKGENSSKNLVRKKWPTAKGQVIVFKTNVGRANFRLQSLCSLCCFCCVAAARMDPELDSLHCCTMATSCIHWAISLKFVCFAFRFRVHSPTRLSAPICCILSLVSAWCLSRVNACPLARADALLNFAFLPRQREANFKSIAKYAALNFNCANFAARPKMSEATATQLEARS